MGRISDVTMNPEQPAIEDMIQESKSMDRNIAGTHMNELSAAARNRPQFQTEMRLLLGYGDVLRRRQ